MKKFTSFGIFIFLLSCSNLSLNNTIRRTPSSLITECSVLLRDHLSANNRRKEFQNYIVNNDFKGMHNLFWKSFKDNLYQIGDHPYTKFYLFMRRINQNVNIPNFHNKQRKISGNVDTFSTLTHATDNSLDYTTEEKKAVLDIKHWIADLKKRNKYINEALANGFESSRVLYDSKGHIDSSFPRDIEVPVINAKGENIPEAIHHESRDLYKLYLEDFEYKDERNLTKGWFGEITKSSKLYQEMVQHAFIYRRLELANEAFHRVARGKLDSEQIELHDLIKRALADDKNKPRRDIMAIVRRKEWLSEFSSAAQIWKIWKKKRIIYNPKYSLPEAFEKAGEWAKPLMYLKTFAFFTFVSGSTYATMQNNPHLQYYMALVSNTVNDILEFFNILTKELENCANSERSYAIENGSTLNDYTESHLSNYTAKSRVTPDFDPEKEKDGILREEYIDEKLDFQVKCLMLRLDHKKAERHVRSKEFVTNYGYAFTAHYILKELIAKDYGERAGELLYNYLKQIEIYENEDKANEILFDFQNELGQDGKNFVKLIPQYRNRVREIFVTKISEGDFEDVYNNSDEFLQKILQQKE